ncbi:MAG: acetyl-CoA carboxylase biotin carboxyl carrier protein subunit, partial [Pseudorhizobium sp.]
PVPGTLVQWNVADGDLVTKGDALAVMDAMKMETVVSAPEAGVISILAEAGSFQNAGDVIARISPSSSNLAGQDVPETLT